MKKPEEIKKTNEEAAPEQLQQPEQESREERQFWLDAKYSDAPSDSDR